MKTTVAIQGYLGSYHHAAAKRYWDTALNLSLCPTFDELCKQVEEGSVDYGLMAIENSIAGTILQNYRLLRDQQLYIIGEVYLQINHHLLGLPGSQVTDLRSIESHPMAINQCLQYIGQLHPVQVIHTDDTAGSARAIAQSQDASRACIASALAAEIYELESLAKAIQTHPINYTRFFVVSRTINRSISHDKASIYIQVKDEAGMLLKVLDKINTHGVNLSKLQSYPVMDSFRSYYFHMDLEYKHAEQLDLVLKEVGQIVPQLSLLGTYHRTDQLMTV